MKSLTKHLIFFLMLFICSISMQAQPPDSDNRHRSNEELEQCRYVLLPLELIQDDGEPLKDNRFYLKVNFGDSRCHPYSQVNVPFEITIEDATDDEILWRRLPIFPFTPDSMIPEYWSYDGLNITSGAFGNIEVTLKWSDGVKSLFVAYAGSSPTFIKVPKGQDLSTAAQDVNNIIGGTNQDFIQFMNIWAGTKE